MERLSSKSLMQGDWVIYFGVPSTILEITRDYILIDEGGPEDTMASINDIKPIPLTSEILEKNGFIKRYNYQWKYRDNSCTIVISIAPQIEIDGEMLGTPPINVILEGALFNINMTSDVCVHQLQHALRLCKIEKEIII